MEQNRTTGGEGVKPFSICSTTGLHNPKPSTDRGMRRHAKRSAEEKKHAEQIWETLPKKTFKEKKS